MRTITPPTTTRGSNLITNPSSIGSSINSLLSPLLKFEFMKHDKWSNVLFLHWRIPTKEMEAIIESHIGEGQFVLDRDKDGSAYIGLVLLTEHNVGPSFIGRKTIFPCVTHHGLNIRTYVKKGENENGIYFASLECDDRFTSWGANYFGMPYQISTIERKYYISSSTKEEDKEIDFLLSSREENTTTTNDDMILNSNNNNTTNNSIFSFSSSRVQKQKNSLLSLLTSWLTNKKEQLHRTSVVYDVNKEKKEEITNNDNPGGGFTVQCEWEINSGTTTNDEQQNNDNNDSKSLSKFFVERYRVYTRKYGLNWRGQIHHEPWPVIHDVKLHHLSIQNIHDYSNKPSSSLSFQPLLQHMAKTPPDHVCFSPGVGPIHFQMLHPV